LQVRQAAFLKEASTLLSLDHPNVIRICGVSFDYRPWVMVFESLRYGDLEHVLRLCRGRQISVGAAEQVYLCGQVAAGMAHVAGHRYTHMDLAARNVLLGERNMVKVADFGNAQVIAMTPTTHDTLPLPPAFNLLHSLSHTIHNNDIAVAEV
jgi:serine/threonine protein kinase